MKRCLAALTVFLVMLVQVAFADFDYAGLKESITTEDNFFTIDENPDSGSSFITPDLFSLGERSFEHRNESDSYYSFFENDWLIMDYATAEAKPLRRLWIYVSSKTQPDISSVTFTFNNNVCTFSDLDLLSDVSQFDNGDTLQAICLVMGGDSVRFHDAIEQYAFSQGNGDYDDVMNLPKIKMTLHGTEDIETELPNSFIIEYLVTDMVFSYADYAVALSMAEVPAAFDIKTEAEATVP